MSQNSLRVLALALKDNCEPFDYYTGIDHPTHKLLEDPENFK